MSLRPIRQRDRVVAAVLVIMGAADLGLVPEALAAVAAASVTMVMTERAEHRAAVPLVAIPSRTELTT